MLLSKIITCVSIVSSILLTLAPILLLTHGQNIDEACVINNLCGPPIPGICKFIPDCPVIYQEILFGKFPRRHCGFKKFYPIVCCPIEKTKLSPIDRIETSTPQPPNETTELSPIDRIETSTPQSPNETRGAVAQAKCAKNAVYYEAPSLFPDLDSSPINMSRCGWKYEIYGGSKSLAKEFPHMVAIGFDRDEKDILWLCGGSLISDRIVLTAAHCTFLNYWGDATWARVGDLHLVREDDDARPQTIKIIERIRHPYYRPPSAYHNIAIMKLESAVIYDSFVKPACLQTVWDRENEEKFAIATGWGQVEWGSDKNSDPDHLLKVFLSLVPYEKCNTIFSDGSNDLRLGIVDEWQICAGESGKDACQGDISGPLVVPNYEHLHVHCMYNVIGITSIGRFCGSNTPGVYTRVYHYIPWIEKTAWPEHFSN